MRRLLSFVCVLAVSAWLGTSSTGAQGPGSPILVVLNNAANPLGAYLPEILRAEGINSFTVADLSAVNSGSLAGVPLVVLAETALTSGQAATFTTYVNGGGRLVAMRPDAQLDGVLGIGTGAASTSNGYVAIDQAGIGAGLQAMTLPFRGEARHVGLFGATSVATLYATASTSTGLPAVVRHGRTAAWMFDLARSTAITRQGNPAEAGIERDGLPLIRTTDPFFQRIDFTRIGVPHADVQMRLFSRTIAALLADALPLPRLWYFPGTARTVMVVTGDSHVSAVPNYQALLGAVEAVGARMTIYLARFLSLTTSPAASWQANGHELSVHPVFAEDGVSGNFAQGYTTVFDWFGFNLPAPVTPGPTVRHHTLEWGGWTAPVSVMAARGIRMDLSYSAFGPTMHLTPGVQQAQAHGFMTGSGLPMRFINEAGQVSPVYQQVTSLADEQLVADQHSEGLSVDAALAVSRSLIDGSQAGGYSAIATQFHVDYYPQPEVKPWVDGTLAYAAGQQIPMMPAGRWLQFVEARAATTLTSIAWNPGLAQLTFAMTVPAAAPPQPLMIPPSFGGRVLARVAVDGQTVAPIELVVNGVPSQVITVGPGAGGAARQILVRYALASTLPAVSIADRTVAEGNSGTTSGALTVTLSAPTPDDVAITYATSGGTATPGADYSALAVGVVVVPGGATTATVPIAVIGDGDYEADETVVVTLSNPVGATLADGAGVLTIANDEPVTAVADAYGTPYRTPLTVPAPGVLANDQSHGRPGLRAALVTSTTHGPLTLGADGSVSYAPPVGWAGTDSFTYRADTDAGLGNVVTVTIAVAHPTSVQPPSGLRVSAMTGNRVTFRWNAPSIGPAAAGYLLEGGIAPNAPMVALPTGLAAPILELAAPTGSFYVRIRTLGAGGPSDPSNEILAHINVAAPPSAPAAFQATSVGNSVHLSWAPSFGGGAPGGYMLDVGGSIVAALPLPNLERLSFAGVPGGAYSLSLRATNGGGASGATAAVAMPVPGACGGPPGPPTNLLAYVAAGITYVVWDPPVTGSAVSSYLLTVPGIGALPLAQRSISGPLPAGSWSITVQAVGPCGASAPLTHVHTVP